MRIPTLAALALVLAACSGSSNGTLKVSITDAPTDLANVSQVLITYDELRVHDEAASTSPDGGPDAATDGVDGQGWIVLCSDTRTIDLMQLTGGRFTPVCAQTMSDGGVEDVGVSVPAGRISQLRLHVASATLKFNDGTPDANLTVPSGPQSGLKINVQQDVPAGGELDLKLDFNAASSINKTGTGTYVLTPVLTVL